MQSNLVVSTLAGSFHHQRLGYVGALVMVRTTAALALESGLESIRLAGQAGACRRVEGKAAAIAVEHRPASLQLGLRLLPATDVGPVVELGTLERIRGWGLLPRGQGFLLGAELLTQPVQKGKLSLDRLACQAIALLLEGTASLSGAGRPGQPASNRTRQRKSQNPLACIHCWQFAASPHGW